MTAVSQISLTRYQIELATARRLLAEGKAQDALAALTKRLKKPGASAVMMQIAAEAHLSLGHSDAALSLLVAACGRDRVPASTYSLLATLAGDSQDSTVDLPAILGKARAEHPAHRKIAFLWAKATLASRYASDKPGAQNVLTTLANTQPFDRLASQAAALLAAIQAQPANDDSEQRPRTGRRRE